MVDLLTLVTDGKRYSEALDPNKPEAAVANLVRRAQLDGALFVGAFWRTSAETMATIAKHPDMGVEMRGRGTLRGWRFRER